MLLESYAVAVLLFFALSAFSRVKARKRAFFNALNGIGLVLGLLALWGEFVDLLVVPTRNKDWTLWHYTSCWYFFRFLFIAALIGAVLVFIATERRKSVKWTVAGMMLLLTPMLLGPIECWKCWPDNYPAYHLAWHLNIFSSTIWWLILAVAGVFFCSSYFLGTDKELN